MSLSELKRVSSSIAVAARSAIQAAANQATGVMIASKQVSDNDKLVIDQIIQHSTSIVSHYDVLGCDSELDRYRCRIQATVSTVSLQHELQAHGVTVQGIDGAGAYAEQVTTRNSILEGRKLVIDALKQVHE